MLRAQENSQRGVNGSSTAGSDSTKTADSNVNLDGVTIISHQPEYRMKGGTMVVNVRNSSLSSAGTGRDVLRQIPGIALTDDGYEVNGKGTPEIYIDNHHVNNIAEIERLQSKDLDKVEIIRQPGAEYGATVTSVIRITTAKTDKDHFGIDAISKNAQGRRLANAEQLNADYQRKGLKLHAMAYYALDHDKRIMSPVYRISSGDGLTVNSHTDIVDRGDAACWAGAMNEDFNRNHSIGFSYEYDDRPDFSMTERSSYYPVRNGIDGTATEESYRTKIKDGTHLFSAFYLGKVKQLKIDFTSDIVAVHSRTDQNVIDGSDIITSAATNFSNLYAMKLILSHPLPAGDVRIGADYTFISRRNWFRNAQNVLPAADNTIHESKKAGFAEYAITAGKVAVTAGLRYEHAATTYWDGGVLCPEQCKTYVDWLPNFSVDFPIAGIQSSVSYTAKKNRPAFDYLQSYLNYNNRYIYEGGNPLLIPETDHYAEWDLSYQWLMVQLSYRYAQNLIAFDSRSDAGNADMAIFSTSNFNHAQFAGASVYASPKFKRWSPVLGIDLTCPFFTVSDASGSKRMNNPMLNITLNNTLNISKSLITNLDLNINTGGDYGPCHSGAYQTVDAGIRKTLLRDALSIHFQVNDIFACHHDFSLYSRKLTYTKHTVPDSRQLVLTIRYTFNPVKAGLKEKHAAEEDINRIK